MYILGVIALRGGSVLFLLIHVSYAPTSSCKPGFYSLFVSLCSLFIFFCCWQRREVGSLAVFGLLFLVFFYFLPIGIFGYFYLLFYYFFNCYVCFLISFLPIFLFLVIFTVVLLFLLMLFS